MSQKLLTIPNCVEKNFFMDFFGFPRGLIAMKCMYEHICVNILSMVNGHLQNMKKKLRKENEEMKSSRVIKSVGFVW